MSDDRLFTFCLIILAIGLIMVAPRHKTPPEGRIAQLEAQLLVAQREVEDWRGKANQAADKMATRKQALQVADTVIRIGLKRADRVIHDTTVSPDTLRLVLAQMVTKVTMYQAEVLRYQESVDSLLQAHLAERSAYEMNMQLLQASVPTPCSYLGLPCPNRTTAYLLGVGTALILAVAVAF